MTTIKNPAQAREEIYSALTVAWLAAGETADTVAYADQPRHRTFPPPDETCPWLRITVQHTRSQRMTISGGSRRFRRWGVVTAQLFCPMGDGLQASDRLSKPLQDSIEGVTTKPGAVYFFNTTTVEVGPDGVYTNTNIISDFYYDEVR